jgi:hypothetical protein
VLSALDEVRKIYDLVDDLQTAEKLKDLKNRLAASALIVDEDSNSDGSTESCRSNNENYSSDESLILSSECTHSIFFYDFFKCISPDSQRHLFIIQQKMKKLFQ